MSAVVIDMEAARAARMRAPVAVAIEGEARANQVGILLDGKPLLDLTPDQAEALAELFESMRIAPEHPKVWANIIRQLAQRARGDR